MKGENFYEKKIRIRIDRFDDGLVCRGSGLCSVLRQEESDAIKNSSNHRSGFLSSTQKRLGQDVVLLLHCRSGDIVVTVCSQSRGRPAGGWAESRFGGSCTNSQFDHSHDDPHDTRYAVTLNEYTVNHSHGTGPSIGRQLVTAGLLAPKTTERRAITKRFSLPKETTIIMAVNLNGRFDYRIQLDGPITGVDPH
jgi:hypothetical protein